MEATSVPILMYHRIGKRRADSIVSDQYVTPGLFAKHLRFLKRNGYRTVSLDEMIGLLQVKASQGKPIVITFDDGYESFYTEALPLLRNEGMTATVFLVSSCIGKTNRWDEAKGDVTERIMSKSQILNAALEGISFGGHSITHPDLRFCDDEMAKREISECKRELRDLLRIPIDWFCYPFGKFLEREQRLVKQAGYKGACGTEKGGNSSLTDLFGLKRINVRATTSTLYLARKLRNARAK